MKIKNPLIRLKIKYVVNLDESTLRECELRFSLYGHLLAALSARYIVKRSPRVIQHLMVNVLINIPHVTG